MGTTTLRDFGRHSERFGEIGFYYAFNYRLWLGQHQVAPDDVMTWCRENCTGFYKVTGYTHKDSERNDDGTYRNKVVFADKVYLADPADVVAIKLMFEVSDTRVVRPRLPRRRSK